jgi:hypothetical protein
MLKQEEKCAVGRLPMVQGSPWRMILESPQSSESIVRPQEIGTTLLLIAVRRESSWNLFISVNKAVAKM